MGFFGKLVKSVVNTAIIPLDVAKDIVTGDFIVSDEPSTVKRMKKVVQSVEQAGEDAGDGDWI